MKTNIKIKNTEYNSVTYICRKCKTLINIKIDSSAYQIKCERCNGRTFFKLKTKNSCQYQCK